MLALVCALTCLVQPAETPQDPLAADIEKAMTNLYSDKHAESEYGKQELTEIGRRAVPRILAELARQRDAARTNQIRVRRILCEILGDIRDNSQPVLDALTGRLADAAEHGLTVAAAAAGALDRIADDRTVGALVTALTSKQAETDKWLAYYCIHALGVMRAPQAEAALKKALEDENAAAQIAGEDAHLIAAAAADAIARIRAKGTVDALGNLLMKDRKDPYSSQVLGVHAARALEKVMGESKGALEGDQTTINASLLAWRKWWGAEQTKKHSGTTRTRLEQISAALEAYKKDHAKYPAILGYLCVKPVDHKGPWPEGGYYKGEGFDSKTNEIKDAWNRALRYDTSGANGAPFDVVSWGGDGRAWGKGDGADLWNHDQWKPAKAEKTKKAMDDTIAAIKRFKDDQARLPENLNDLVVKPQGALPKEFPKDGYLKERLKDGFDSFLEYRPTGTGGEPYDLISWGADLAPGGLDENADTWSHDKWKQPRADDTKKKIEALAKAIELFKKEQERYPAQLADLREKPTYVKKAWPVDGYVKDLANRDPVNDAFGNAFVYRLPGTGGEAFDLISLGADGREGGTGPDEDQWHKPKK